jgi:hypothetical protein
VSLHVHRYDPTADDPSLIGDHGAFSMAGDTTPMPQLDDYPDRDTWANAIRAWFQQPGVIDTTADCPMCGVTVDIDALCGCDTDPMCIRDHRIYHVERRTA